MESEPVVVALQERISALEERLVRSEERCDKRISEMEQRCHREKELLSSRGDRRERFLVVVAGVSLLVAAIGNVFGPEVGEIAHDAAHMVIEEDD